MAVWHAQDENRIFYSNVPRRSILHFVARESIQTELQTRLLEDTTGRAVILYGMGGSGKTQLALRRCHLAKEYMGFLATLWINASTPTTVKQSYKTIANAIMSDFLNDDIETTIFFVQDKLRNWTQPWLVVLDNYDNPGAFQGKPIKDYIPNGKAGHVLFTSRHAGLQRLGLQIPVSEMNMQESVQVLLQRPPTSLEEETEAQNIASMLGHLALTLDQAGSYIRARKLPLNEFVSHYRDRKEVVLKEIPDEWEYRKDTTTFEHSTPLSAFTTWEMSFDLIGGDEEVR